MFSLLQLQEKMLNSTDWDALLKYSAQSEHMHFTGRLCTIVSSCRSLYCIFALYFMYVSLLL